MKNRVNIAKLIDKKYSGGQMTLSEFNELIDSVISEKLDGYWGKVDTAELEEISQSEDVFDHAFGMGGAENPIAKEPGYGGREPSNVIPHKIAEAGEEIKTKTESISIDVPDIFSLVTNSQMGLASENDKDRQLIDKIIKRMDVSGKRNWITRIQSMQRFIDDETGQARQFRGDIRTAVANLIFLNLIKKISYSVAQPGKLFEYIIAPLISSTARVVGAADDKIVDVTKTYKGTPGSYSIKFFTGDTPGIDVVGSRENLTEHIKQSGTPVTYIIASVDKGAGIIQFAELLVTTDYTWFSSDEEKGKWREIAYKGQQTLQHGAILTSDNDGVTRFGIWVNPTGVATQIPANTSIGKEKETPADFATTGIDIPFFNNQFKSTKNKTRFLNQMINNIKAADNVTALEKILNNNFSSLNDIRNINKTINQNNFRQFRDLLFQNLKELNFNIVQAFGPRRTREQIQNALFQLSKTFEDKIKEEYKKLIPTSPQEPTLEEQQVKKEGTQFSIPLQGSWLRLSRLQLNLGKPEDFKKAQLNIASGLADDMRTTLTAYKNLSTNIVGFFATTQQENNVDYGSEAMKNAEDIKDGVSGFMKKENSGIK